MARNIVIENHRGGRSILLLSGANLDFTPESVLLVIGWFKLGFVPCSQLLLRSTSQQKVEQKFHLRHKQGPRRFVKKVMITWLERV